jgi:repressor LexA
MTFLFQRARDKHSQGRIVFRNQDLQSPSSFQRRVNPRLAEQPSRQRPGFGKILLWFLFASVSLLVRLFDQVPIWNTSNASAKISSPNSLFVRYNTRMSVTRRQKEVVDFISGFVEENGYSPSFDEIARGLNLKSLATVHKHVTNLQKKGLLERAHNRSRSIDILPQKSKSRQSERLPLVGRIAAGLPVDAAEASESISLGDIIGNKDVYALEVRGDSMRDEHIVNGDYVLVERVKTARPGEIVVALVRGSETTLKRYYMEGEQVRLQPSNVEMAPIYVPAQDLAIQGRVLGILRKYA